MNSSVHDERNVWEQWVFESGLCWGFISFFFCFHTFVLVIYHHNQNKSYMNKPDFWLVFKAADQGRLYEKTFYL